MKQLLLCILALVSIATYGQEKNEKILYVVDSIPIFKEISEEEGNLPETCVDYINVVTTKENFGDYKIYDFDKIIFVFTKEYTKRPEEIKKIPSFPNKFYKNDEKYCLRGSSLPYTGKYIDYYLTGIKKDEGFIKDGLDDGPRNKYYQDGTLKLTMNYSKGIKNGEWKSYFSNGKLWQTGAYKNNKEDGTWEEWYSTGTLKKGAIYKNGKIQLSDSDKKLDSFVSKGLALFEKGDYKGAVVSFSKAIELNASFSDIYFHRSRAYLYDLKFDEAITDCDKAIELEPLYKEAYSNRAFVRIRKYELKDSRNIYQNKEVTVYTSKKDVEIPADDKAKICSDLKKGYELGDTKSMIKEAIQQYCK